MITKLLDVIFGISYRTRLSIVAITYIYFGTN